VLLADFFHAYQRTNQFTGLAGTLEPRSPKFSSIVAGCFLSWKLPPQRIASSASVKNPV